jgi:hypothetical protein
VRGNGQHNPIERKSEDVLQQIRLLEARQSQSLSRMSESRQADDLVPQASVMATWQHLQRKSWQLQPSQERVDGGLGDLREMCGMPTDADWPEVLVAVTG